ncbi:hypothetical protein ScPMuIL_000095 [Solemya velum]
MAAGAVKVGVNVDIQRTDGRIHSAVISGIHEDSHSVTVEWFERGETKGKEIELDAIFALNPDLNPGSSQAPTRESNSAKGNRPQRTAGETPRGSIKAPSSAKTRPSYAANNPPRPAVVKNGHVEQSSSVPDVKKSNIAVNAAARRKSNCVKEVEKIKQRRDERRAHQQVIKEQIDQEYDMSDPNILGVHQNDSRLQIQFRL